MKSRKRTPEEQAMFLGPREPHRRGELVFPSTEKVDAHRDLLAAVIKRLTGLGAHEFAVSDESYLSDFDAIDPDALLSKAERLYGIQIARRKEEPFLWEVLVQIAAQRQQRTRVQ